MAQDIAPIHGISPDSLYPLKSLIFYYTQSQNPILFKGDMEM